MLAMLLAAPVPAALASDGSVTINGLVEPCTCVINDGNKDIRKELPTLSASTLSKAGATAGDIKFTIKLSGCSTNRAVYYFEAGPNIDTTNNILANIAGTGGAKNVGIQLLNGAGKPVKLGALESGVEGPLPGVLYVDLYARYYATGVATSGPVKGFTSFSIQYL